MSLPPGFLASLSRVVGEEHVLTDTDLRAGYERDWTGRWRGDCDAVVRPGSTADVAAVLATCDAARVAVVPQAGNTGLVGGGVPRAGASRPSIVLSLRRLDTIGPVDTEAMQVTVGAGVSIADWRTAARAAGVDAPLDFAARDTATVGGAIATNAGGSRVVRFGTMRAQVVGVEAVLADGRVVGSLAGLPKETAGLHWPSVLCGSEGTLGVITAARVRVVPRYDDVTTAAVAVESIDAARRLLGALRRNVPTLDSVEMIGPAAVALVVEHLGVEPPLEGGAVTLVVECAGNAGGSRDTADDLLPLLDTAAGVVASAVATDGHRRRQLLDLRDRIPEAIGAAAAAIGDPTFKLDVAVPVGSLGRLLQVAARAADDDGARLVWFGHLAEGNVHLNHLGAADPDRIADRVLATVAELGGTISAEHGVGVAKARWLPLVRSAAELEALRAIKLAVDPNETLNPGVLDPRR